MTAWAHALVEEARSLTLQRRFRSAMDRLLVVLDICPDLPAALEMAAPVISLGTGAAQAANHGERLGPQLLLDSRLDAMFCACESPGCTASWLSAHWLAQPGTVTIVVNAGSPGGGRCQECGVTLCRNHAKRTEVRYYQDGPPEFTRVQCSRCGGEMDSAPAPNGRRRGG
ncbi:hypothetical protein, partial [Frankia sp. CiP3]|uniref:hypothetical protein n=1 Tax=Frankia sp. CiP3 TaxID=2880971 RepID=UPI001EF4B577